MTPKMPLIHAEFDQTGANRSKPKQREENKNQTKNQWEEIGKQI